MRLRTRATTVGDGSTRSATLSSATSLAALNSIERESCGSDRSHRRISVESYTHRLEQLLDLRFQDFGGRDSSAAENGPRPRNLKPGRQGFTYPPGRES